MAQGGPRAPGEGLAPLPPARRVRNPETTYELQERTRLDQERYLCTTELVLMRFYRIERKIRVWSRVPGWPHVGPFPLSVEQLL